MNIIPLKTEHYEPIIHKWVNGGGRGLRGIPICSYWGLTSKIISWAEESSFCSYQDRGRIRWKPPNDWSSWAWLCWILMNHRLSVQAQSISRKPSTTNSCSWRTTENCAAFDQVIKISTTQAKPLDVCVLRMCGCVYTPCCSEQETQRDFYSL